jgi:hypothetical protein
MYIFEVVLANFAAFVMIDAYPINIRLDVVREQYCRMMKMFFELENHSFQEEGKLKNSSDK